MNKGLFFVGFMFLLHGTAFSGGPDGGMSFDWNEIKTVKGGVKECVYTAIVDDPTMAETGKAVFDAKGRIASMSTATEKKVFIYDKNGRLAEIKSGYIAEGGKFEESGSSKYTFDAKSKMTKLRITGGMSNPDYSPKIFDYDKNGNFKIEDFSAVMGIGTGYSLYSKDMVLLEKAEYDPESVMSGAAKPGFASKMIYSYDKQGNLTQKALNNLVVSEGVPKKITWKYQYQFDKNGNKILETVTVNPADATDYRQTPFRKITFVYDGKGSKDNTEVKIDSAGLVNKRVKVEYDGAWYQATILKVEGDKYFIHYDDYDTSWDEWVTADRMDLTNSRE